MVKGPPRIIPPIENIKIRNDKLITWDGTWGYSEFNRLKRYDLRVYSIYLII